MNKNHLQKFFLPCLIIALVVDIIALSFSAGEIINLNEKIRITELKYKSVMDSNSYNRRELTERYERQLNYYIDDLSAAWIQLFLRLALSIFFSVLIYLKAKNFKIRQL